MEKLLKQIIDDIGAFRNEVNERLDVQRKILKSHGKRLGDLEVMVSGIREEHGRMLGAIIESKDAQRGEIDSLQHQSALVEGTLKRAANVIIEDLAKAK